MSPTNISAVLRDLEGPLKIAHRAPFHVRATDPASNEETAFWHVPDGTHPGRFVRWGRRRDQALSAQRLLPLHQKANCQQRCTWQQ